MSLPRIAVATGALAGLDELAARMVDRAEIRIGDITTPTELATTTAGCTGLAVSLQRLTAAHFEALFRSVRVIGRAGVGLDTIDLQAAARHGVAVVYQPDYATNEVADQALALLLAAHRRVVQADRAVREQGWAGASNWARSPPFKRRPQA